MLSDSQLRKFEQLFLTRMQAIAEKYYEDMGRHLHEIGTLSPTDVHRLTELKRVGVAARAIKKQVAEAANKSAAEIEIVFREIAEHEYRFAQQYYGAANTAPIRKSALLRLAKAQAKQTAAMFANLSRTTIESSLYRNAVDKAVQAVQTGVTDYKGAIRAALREAGAEGLRVQYPSGVSRRLDTAVRQNVLDGARQIQSALSEQIGKQVGADGVEISAHATCAEDHLPYQGRQFSNMEFERLQATLKRPIGQWNCRHVAIPIILGVSEPAYSDAELERYRANSREQITIDGVTRTRYEWTQEQRRIETAIRERKNVANLAKASGDDVLRREAQAHINQLDAAYARISDRAGLYERRDRLSVAGFRRVKPLEELKTKTEYGTIKTYREMLKEHAALKNSELKNGLPIKGKADSIVDLVDDAGKVLQRRVYGLNALAAVDFDTGNHNRPDLHPTGAHKHVFDYSKKHPRGINLPLSETDLKYNSDIIKKGVNYFDPK